MNQKQAKRLRAEVYGKEHTQEPKYQPQLRRKGGKLIRTRAVECIGERKQYKDLKKEYKRNRRNN